MSFHRNSAFFFFLFIWICVGRGFFCVTASGNLTSLKGNPSFELTKTDRIEEEELNDAILNLDDYITAISLKVDPDVELKNSTKRDLTSIPQYFESGQAVAKKGAICSACKILVGVVVLHIRQYNTSEKHIREKLEHLCPLFRVGTTPEVCLGLIERLVPTMYFVLKHRPQLKVPAFCGFVFQQFGCETNDPYLEWSVDLSDMPKRRPGKPVNPDPDEDETDYQDGTTYQNPPKNIGNPEKPWVKLKSGGGKRIKILQLADLHIDLLYAHKSQAVCDNNVQCCRNSSKPNPLKPGASAGFFADNHKCDPPLSLLELTLRHITQQHPDIDLVYMTGDIVAHTVYSSTRPDNTEVVVQASKVLHRYFQETPVIVMIGNHEPHPVNFFSPQNVPDSINTRWIYEVTYEAWKQWIPPGQRATYFTEGFYIVQQTPTFKILAVNTNVCYGFNFWGMYDVKDPSGQLEWLIQELDKAEQNKQTVHIVGHVPPGHPDCNKVWSRNFYNIISRYRSTVRGQFYGHTHYDELKIYFSPTESGKAINNLFISPSLTPYELNNPAYKIFYADPETMDIMDYETWLFNLDEANKTPEKTPEWFPLYRATSFFDIPDTRPENLGKLVNQMAANKTTFDYFNQFYHKALEKVESSTFHQKSILCGIVRPYANNEEECNRTQKQVDGQVVAIPVRAAKLRKESS